MSIKVICPNGHSLQVKSEFAGKSGRCPFCKASIVVPKFEAGTAEITAPKPERLPVSEDEVLAVLGTPVAVQRTVAESASPPRDYPPARKEEPKKEVSFRADSDGLMKRKRVCPKCCSIISITHVDCPQCRTPLSDWTFPVPNEHCAEERKRSMCHYLGVRKHEGVTIIRFGEHKILDEITIKKFGDELFQVADRPDCKNLLLNFVGVVGLSSVMLGIILMLRKKMSQKPGTLKLCQVGPEIMDIFNATKLGQLFEVLGSEQEALHTFA